MNSRPFSSECEALFFIATLTIAIAPKVVVPSLAYTSNFHAYRVRVTPTLDGLVLEGEWNDTQLYNETETGMTFASKHDGNYIYILLNFERGFQLDNASELYFGIEFDNNGDTTHMGSSISPDDAVFVSPRFFNSSRDAFLSGLGSVSWDDEHLIHGAVNNWEGKLSLQKSKYVVEIRRPLATQDSVGHDVSLSVGKSVGIGFAVGEFGKGVAHKATDMKTYVLTIEDAQYVSTRIEGSWSNLTIQLTFLLISVIGVTFAAYTWNKRKTGKLQGRQRVKTSINHSAKLLREGLGWR